MELMDHERLLLAKFYCEQALETISDRSTDAESGGWSAKLFSVSQSMKRGADFAKGGEE